MGIELDETSIIKASSQFWDQMLAMSLDPLPASEEFCLGTGHLVGMVNLSGAWNGRIEIRMDEGLAYVATAAMLMQPLETVAEADRLDAVKEIANMIAGVLKSSLPRPCAMTVPEADVKSEQLCSVLRNNYSVAVAFHHEAGNMMVCVLMLEQPSQNGLTGTP
jgi:CheY-specific phosphatase CheX